MRSEATHPVDSIGSAIQFITSLVQQKRLAGEDIFQVELRAKLNPGDIYDAYEAIGRSAVAEDILEEKSCGPLAALFLYLKPSEDPTLWRQQVAEMFDEAYVKGFQDGFALVVSDAATEQDSLYVRGVCDGVMAHAAVF